MMYEPCLRKLTILGDSARPRLWNTSHSGRLAGVSIGCQMGFCEGG